MSARELRIVLVAVMTGMFLGAIDGTIVSTALPTIVGDLGGQSQAPWIGTGFLLAQTIGTPIIGKLSDIYGRKVTFQTTIVVFLLTSLLCGIAQSMVQLVAFRFLQGLSAAGLLALPFAIMGDLMSPTERARNQGYAAGTFLVAALIGPLLGGFIVDASSWRWIFLINIPVGAVALAAVQKHLHIPRKPTRAAIDVPGALTLTLGHRPARRRPAVVGPRSTAGPRRRRWRSSPSRRSGRCCSCSSSSGRPSRSCRCRCSPTGWCAPP